ncbi:MAG: hypothetical protein HYZ93_04700 [Candidatus Omnitrophica bacterium]|nr:hypothetical protein [Candidatus Omnitrophota bacterium]
MATSSKILLVAAVRQELAPFLATLNGDGRVEVLLTGIGRRRAFEAVTRRLGKERCAAVVSAGFAGGTRPGLRVGDLVVPEEVIDASSGRRWKPAAGPPRDGFAPSGLAMTCGGFLVTADRVFSTPRGKGELGARYGAVAVDMETAAVAEAATAAGLPWASIRVILDPLEVPLWGNLLGLMRGVRLASRSLSDGLEKLITERC